MNQKKITRTSLISKQGTEIIVSNLGEDWTEITCSAFEKHATHVLDSKESLLQLIKILTEIANKTTEI